MPLNLGEILLSALTGPLQVVLASQLESLLSKIEPLETRKTILVALYPIIDVELEKLTTKTKTKIDDAAIIAFKLAIEGAASTAGIDLPNLDND